jgi:tetratricopeptide (TPR) repeat protein
LRGGEIKENSMGISARDHHRRGVDLFDRGEYRPAIRAYDRAIRVDPRNAVFLNDRGIARKKIGDLDGAMEDFAAAVEADPSYWPSYANRGNLLCGLEDFKGAVQEYSLGLAAAPGQPTLLRYRANARGCIHDYEGAVGDYTEALRRDPDPEILLARGVAYRVLAELSGAEGDVVLEGRVHRHDRRHSRSRLQLALADLEAADRALPADSPSRTPLTRYLREVRAGLAEASRGAAPGLKKTHARRKPRRPKRT